MTFGELCNRMDAQELMEWAAYIQTTDEETRNNLEFEIAKEQDEITRHNNLRNFLFGLGGGN